MALAQHSRKAVSYGRAILLYGTPGVNHSRDANFIIRTENRCGEKRTISRDYDTLDPGDVPRRMRLEIARRIRVNCAVNFTRPGATTAAAMLHLLLPTALSRTFHISRNKQHSLAVSRRLASRVAK